MTPESFTTRYSYYGQVWINDTGSEFEINNIIKSWFRSVKLSREKAAFKPKLKYTLAQTSKCDKNTTLPIPDGYKYVDSSNLSQNRDWKYIVPEKYVLSKDHIDAKPYSIGLAKNAYPIEGFSTDDKIIDNVIAMLDEQIAGLFNKGLEIKKHIISKHCALIYQLNWDGNTYKWCKLKGVFISGDSMYQFHAFANYKDEVAYRFDTKSKFEDEIKNWADKIVCLIDKNNNGMNSVSTKNNTENLTFTAVDADKSLYERYASRIKMRGFGNMIVVNNNDGADYSLISLTSLDDDKYQRIVARDKSNYTLDKLADKFKGVFRVDKSAFDSAHDRECEIAEGIMYKDYNLVALRSFAWTLTECCKRYNISPSDLTLNNLVSLIDFVSRRKWLNFDDTLCKGLCSGRDLHVFYIPDSTTQTEKSAILPSDEEYEDLKRMQKIFPSYNGGLLAQTASVDELRKDLEYISPAIETLWNSLCSNRNTKEELKGDVADVVYAFCAMAKAAKHPFFTEDGPGNCDFNQITDKVILDTNKNNIDISKQSNKEKSVDSVKKVISLTETEAKKSWYFKKLKSGYSIQGYKGTKLEAEVPSYIDGIAVTSMGHKEKGYKKITKLIVPDTVTLIKENAFKDASTLKTIILPPSVKTIEDSAFSGCVNLKNVNIPDGISTIGGDTFEHCESLKQLIIPESVQTIADNAFSYCISLENIELGNVSRYVYKNNCLIDTEKKILLLCKDGNFIPDDGSVTEISCAFSGRKNIKSVTIPSTITNIGNKSFADCIGLKNIIIPEGVKNIGFHAFDGCTSLTQLVLPDSIEKLGSCCFSNCTGLISIKLPVSCDCSSNSFEGCSSLKEIDIPDEVENLPCFKNCKSLEKINLGKKVKNIGWSAIEGCTSLKKFDTTRNDKYKFINNCLIDVDEKKLVIAVNGAKIPDDGSVKILGSFSFFNATWLTELVIPEGVTTVEPSVIRKCSNLKKLVIPTSITSFHSGWPDPLEECYSLTDVYYTGTERQWLNNEVFCSLKKNRIFKNQTIHYKYGKRFAIMNQSYSKPSFTANKFNRTQPTTLQQQKKQGCYVATAVYGSYDCPEVWILRRFRDYSLAMNWLGRLFITLYYAVSPTVVKLFGDAEWFNKLWKDVLDRLVERLRSKGYEDTPYMDK